jgi:hypothetical protein
MTSSHKPSTSKRWPAWSWIPVSAFLILYLASGFVGVTDDEAYYWVLAQKPALGYAYHPPGVAWMIWLAQMALGWAFGPASAFVIRFFSCLSMGLMFALSLDWMNRSGARAGTRAAFSLASFAGLFALGWMMVPDTPLYVGWMVTFYCSWRIAFEQKLSPFIYVVLGAGVCIAILGKYSGVLVPFSAIFAIWTGPFGRRRFLKAFAFVSAGTILGVIPIVIWNSQHEWQSILYQIQERHQGSELSWKRYLRFWLIELVAAGPVLLFYSLNLIRRSFAQKAQSKAVRPVIRFVIPFLLPAALIYCIQPLWSDFKPHWAFIVWFPGALVFAWEASRGEAKLAKTQMAYGVLLIVVVLASLQFPLMGRVIRRFHSGYDPRWDVTNDLYGWSKLREFSESHRENGNLPYFIGSRYQTASQAAVSLGSLQQVSMIPRDLKARDEWPLLPVSKGIGPEWPELTRPVFFVGDNRYDAPPEFRASRCEPLAPLETYRGGLPAKKILIWNCRPINWPD